MALASTVVAAIAAVFSALSAYTSLRATKAVEAEVLHQQRITTYELFRSFEADYASQYGRIWGALGPWPGDPPGVDEDERRAVHDVLTSLASIYRAQSAGLVGADDAEYVGALFLDWLSVPRAEAVWRKVFAGQDDTWPEGFAAFVEAGLASRRS